MEKIRTTRAWVPREAIQSQIAAITDYAIAFEQERLWIRGYLRNALAALDRDNFELVQVEPVSGKDRWRR